MQTTTRISSLARASGVAVALLGLAACASMPPPTGLMQRAQQQLDAARNARAGDYAPVDLQFATQRFQSAQNKMNDNDYAAARDLANESLADGRLAQTRAELAATRKKIVNQRAKNTRLRNQLLNPAKASSGSSNGLPEEITLPQPSSGAPAPATSSGHPSSGDRS
jgi:predicted S18 family serine protease